MPPGSLWYFQISKSQHLVREDAYLLCLTSKSFQIMVGPLYRAIQEKEELLTNYDLTNEEIKQIIIFMGTITVISFILVISLSTIFIFFIW